MENIETQNMAQDTLVEKLVQINRVAKTVKGGSCLLYTSPSPRDGQISRMPSSA